MTYANDMPAETALASELRTTVMRLARQLRRQRADSSLTLNQLSVLGSLVRHGPMTPGELAVHERVQPPSITRVIAKLEAADLLTRTDHPTDGRQVLVAVSPTGMTMIREDRRRRDEWLAKRMHALSPEDLSVLHEAARVLDQLAGS